MLLKEGSKGLAVVRLQLQLRHLDCYIGNVSGICDKETVVAIITYQTIKNIVVDGISGNQTNGHLKKDSKNAFFALFLHCAATAEDCPEPGDCDPGYIPDCVDADCCPESWIGDGFEDCHQFFDIRNALLDNVSGLIGVDVRNYSRMNIITLLLYGSEDLKYYVKRNFK